MKIKVFIILFLSIFIASCGAKKTVQTSKRKVVIVEPEPEKLPSVKQVQHVRKLERKYSNLDKNVLRYIRKYAPIAVSEMHEYKIPASITLAQGVLESSSGRSLLSRKSNNHFGIKCHRGWKGERVYHDDDERGECFRKYKYVETSYRDHSKFLKYRKRYAFLFKLKRTNYKAWAKGLKKAGYATDRKYPKKLIRIIEKYKLYEFDKLRKKDLKKLKKQKKDIVVTKPQKSYGNYYKVKKGDTLYSIAKRHGISVQQLKKINGLKSNTISVGQHLLTK